MTKTDLLALLATEGLPQQLSGSIVQLIEAINQGHTAYPLDAPTSDQWQETRTLRSRSTVRMPPELSTDSPALCPRVQGCWRT